MKHFLLAIACVGLFACEIPSDLSKNNAPLTIGQVQNEHINIPPNTHLVFVSPGSGSVEVVGKTPVTFLFDKPIFLLQNPARVHQFLSENIAITPSIEGSWQTVGTTGMMFEPKTEWVGSTQYEFTLSEQVIGQSIQYHFETPRLKLQGSLADELIGRKPLIVLLNQPISLEEAQKLKLIPETPFDVQYQVITEKNEQGEEVSTTIFSHIELIPQVDWLEDHLYTLTIPQDIVAQEGPLLPQDEQKQEFRTIRPFAITEETIPEDVFQSINIGFSAAVKAKDLLDFLMITPTPEDAWQSYRANKQKEYEERGTDYAFGYFNFKPVGDYWLSQVEHTITLRQGLKDVHGRTLTEDYTRTFTPVFPDRVQPIYFPWEAKSYRHGTNPVFSFWYSGSVQSPELKIEKVFPRAKSFSQSLNLPPSPTQRTVIELDLQELFPALFTSEGYLASGWYELTLSWQEPHYRQQRISTFAITDFPVELKKSAHQTFDVYPLPFPGETLPEGAFLIKAYTERWNQQGKTIESIYQAEDQTVPMRINTDQYNLYVLLQNDDQIGIGSTYFNKGIQPYDAPISFSPYQYNEKITGVTFPDRPLFQPRDKVYFKSIFRERNFFEKAFPLKVVDIEKSVHYRVTIMDPQYQEVFSQEYDTKGGSLDGAWDIPDTAALGNYQLTVLFLDTQDGTGISSTKTNFYVTEYRKPNFLIDTTFSESRAVWKDMLQGNISAEYAFGGNLSGKKVNYTLSLFGHEKTIWYWNTGARRDRLITQGQTFLDGKGLLKLPINLDLTLDKDIDWNLLNLDVTVETSLGEQSSKIISIPFYRSEVVIELEGGQYFYDTLVHEITTKGKITDLDGQPLQQKLKAELFQEKWVRGDRKGSDGQFIGEWEKTEERIIEQEMYANKAGEFTVSFARPPISGNYFVRITSLDKEDRMATVEQYFWVWTDQHDRFNLRQNDTNKILPLYADFDDYLVGNQVQVLFPHNQWPITRVHATIERGTILETLEPDLEHNTLSFSAEAWMAPNVFVTLLIEGVDEQGPQVRWGSINIPIRDRAHELEISLHSDKEQYQPQEFVHLQIQTRVGSHPVSGEITVAIVDQTLLALISRPKLELWKHFLADLPLGVETFHTLANFMSEKDLQDIYAQVEKIKASNESPFGGGGSDEAKGGEFKPRGDFRDTAAFLATVETDENGEATVDIPLPDNLTTWHVWAVGHTIDNAFGEAETEFKTSLPLLLSPIVPNFIRAGDRTDLGLLIRRNLKNPVREEIKVTLTIPEDIEAVEEMEQTIKVKEEERIFFPVKIPYNKATFPIEGKEVEIRLDIESESGLRDAIVLKRKIFPPVTTTSVAEFLDVKEPTHLTFKSDEGALKSTIVVKAFGTLLDRLPKFVEIAYSNNYLCAEQRLSYWTTRLFQEQIFSSMGKAYDPVERQELEKVRDFIFKTQDDSSRGFKFWSGSWKSSEWLTTQVLEFAPLWEEFGVVFPEDKLQKAREWLSEQVNRSCDEHWCMSEATRQQGAFILLQKESLEKSALEFLLEYTSSVEAKVWWLRSAYLFDNAELSPRVREKKEIYTEDIQRMMKARDRYLFWEESERSFYSQNERLTAIIFEWIQENNLLESKESKIARYLTHTKGHLSGNTALRILKSLKNYTETTDPSDFPVDFTVKTETENLMSGRIESALDFVQREKIVGKGFKPSPTEGVETITFTSEVNKSYYADIELHEIFAASDLSSINKGFWIEREYYELDDKDFEEPVINLEVGKNYVVRIKLSTNAEHRQVVIEDSIPSGVEGVNFDLDNEDQQLQKHAGMGQKDQYSGRTCMGWCQPLVEHQEFYHDKVRFFIPDMGAGAYEIKYIVRARLKGEYDLSPIKVLEMYYPEVFATGEGRRVTISN